MRTTTIACDRCSATIDGTISILEAKHGDLAKQLDQPLDLCASCADLFLDWIRPQKFELTTSELTATAQASISRL
jgi:hypothetical protein